MNRLTKIIAPALAVSLALGAAIPASAAPFVNSAGHVRIELSQLDRQIDTARARHRLSNGEAVALQNKVDRAQNLYRTYSRNGFSGAELRSLENRIDIVKRGLARQTVYRGHRR